MINIPIWTFALLILFAAPTIFVLILAFFYFFAKLFRGRDNGKE